MTYVDKIISHFGGIRPMAGKIDRPVSTVQGWKNRGSIPDDQKEVVVLAANDLGLGLVASDYLPVPIEHFQSEKGAA